MQAQHQRDAPVDQADLWQGGTGEFEVTRSYQGHEDIGGDQKPDGQDGNRHIGNGDRWFAGMG